MTASATIHDLQTAKGAGLPASAPLAIQQRDTAVMPGFNSSGSWELAQRIGKAFASSSLVPQQYQGNLPNCIVALEMANRMGASPLMVMQNLYIVHGNPGWSSKFLIASFNQSGKFSAIRYEFERDAKGKATGCRAWAVEKATGEKLVGATITTEMAQSEGWATKSGSKWKTMPEQMLMYRAAAFFVRTYAPEISMGLRTTDEIEDGVIDAMPGSVTSISDLQEGNTPAAASPVIDPLDNPEAGADPMPPLLFDEVRRQLEAAKTPEAFDTAKALIPRVVDAEEQAKLNALASKRYAAIAQGE